MATRIADSIRMPIVKDGKVTEWTEPMKKPHYGTPRAEFAVLSSELSKGAQSVELIELLEFKGRKLKLQIYSDAYKFQSYARVSVFFEAQLKWNPLVSIPHGNMKTVEGICYYPGAYGPKMDLEKHRFRFNDDRETLLGKVRLIL